MKKQELSLMVKARCSTINKRGLAKTSIMLSLNSQSTECYLGYLMPPEHWDEVEKRCREDHPSHQYVNDIIEDALEELKAHHLILSKRMDNVSVEDIKKAYKGETDEINTQQVPPIKEKTLLNIADQFIKDFEELVKEKKRSNETLKQWNSTREKIAEFASYFYQQEDILPKQLTDKFGDELYKYLTLRRTDFNQFNTKKRKKANVEEAYARKQIKNIKQLLNIAVTEKLIATNPLENFQTFGGDKEVIPLELHEIERIHNKELSIPRLEEVRDAYIFQCFTGFAYSDLFELTPDHITYVGINRNPWLMKERGKTKVNEMVPILPIVQELINKYKNHSYCLAHNKLIPLNSNSNYNAYLKELAIICGIKRELKTHLARHTFADIMLNVCDFPLEDVSKMLGHSSLRTTVRYCRVRKERIARHMKTAYDVLFDKSGKLNFNAVA